MSEDIFGPEPEDLVAFEYQPAPIAPAPRQGHVTAEALQLMSFPPVQYVIPGYVVEGCTLLAGRPKLGKSWLVLEMGLAVASGGCCLGGTPCEDGDVLYLALEDNWRRLQSRIEKVHGSAADWPHRLHLATEWPRANNGGLTEIERWIRAAEKPRLILVDVLAMFRQPASGRDSPYEADYAAIKGLQALASEYRVAIVVVHHTRKGGGDADPFEKVSGTLGLSGAADTTLVLDRDGNGATLYGRGRDVEEFDVALEFNKGDCRWFALGRAGEVRRTDERADILTALYEADELMGPREIAIATGAERNSVDQLLYKMCKAGEIRKLGRGRYAHPDRADLIEPPLTPDKNDKKIRSGGVEEEPEPAVG